LFFFVLGQYSYLAKVPLLDGYFKTVNSDGKEGWVEVLSWKPRIFYFHHFLTDEECDHIIKLGTVKKLHEFLYLEFILTGLQVHLL
jgi:hypothetical protein